VTQVLTQDVAMAPPVPGGVAVIVPAGLDDPARPSGGNVYDRRLITGLREAGWRVTERSVAAGPPAPADLLHTDLDAALADLPDGMPVVLDGLVVCAAPRTLEAHARRLRLVVLVHLPLGVDPSQRPGEKAALACAAAVVGTSRWTWRWLLDVYELPPDAVHEAPPGVDASALTEPTADGRRLLCVAAVTPGKGHDTLVAALSQVRHSTWTCACVGSLVVDPAYVTSVRCAADSAALGERWRLVGPVVGSALDHAYATADLLVVPSALETYGMVVTEALARGLPVLATDRGGIREALGRADDEGVPGLLVPPGDPVALAAALDAWLADPGLRRGLRRRARQRRETLSGWSTTVARVSHVLEGVVR
jgi:glycosyltransferase involved in cell wall biosynthesis